MPSAISGKMGCIKEGTSECAACSVTASGFQVTVLLNHNAYSDEVAMEWEKQVYEANAKTFNNLTGYHTELMEGQHYNETLYKILTKVINDYKAKGVDMIPLKTDFLAERAIPDNIEE